MAKLTHEVLIKAVDKASGSFKSVGKSSKGLQTNLFELTGIASNLKNITGPLVDGFKAMAGAMGEAIKLAIEQERVEKQLEAVLKSTGEVAGLTADELKRMASGFQDVTTFGDEAIIAGQNILLTFKEIGGDDGIFERTTAVVMDVATAMGMDLKGAALQVGKALNDPTTGLSMLTRVGITFTEEQKKVIKSLQATGDIAGAQTIILKELESQFGGSAKAMRDTFGGALQSLQNTFFDILEDTGQLVTKNQSLLKVMREFEGIIADVGDEVESYSASLEGSTLLGELAKDGILLTIDAIVLLLDSLDKARMAIWKYGEVWKDAIPAGEKSVTIQIMDAEKALQNLGRALDNQRGTWQEGTFLWEQNTRAADEWMEKLRLLEAQLPVIGQETLAIREALAGFREEVERINPELTDAEKAMAAFTQDGTLGLVGFALGVTSKEMRDFKDEMKEVEKNARNDQMELDRLASVMRKKLFGALKEGAEFFTDLNDEQQDWVKNLEGYGKAWRAIGSIVSASIPDLTKGKDALKIVAPTGPMARPVTEEEFGLPALTALGAAQDEVTDSLGEAVGYHVDALKFTNDREMAGKSISSALRAEAATARNLNETIKAGADQLESKGMSVGGIAETFHEAGLNAEAMGELGAKGVDEIIEKMQEIESVGDTNLEKAKERTDEWKEMQKEALDDVKKAQEESYAELTQLAKASAQAVGTSWEIAAARVRAAASDQLILLKLMVLNFDALEVNWSGAAFAEGGTVNRPTFAMIGEDGPETVIPENKPERARELLAGLFQRNPELSGFGGGGGGGSSINGGVSIVVNTMGGDGEELADIIAGRMDEILGRRAMA